MWFGFITTYIVYKWFLFDAIAYTKINFINHIDHR
jgi:hypothetical protein